LRVLSSKKALFGLANKDGAMQKKMHVLRLALLPILAMAQNL
jgi:hypothetical protein